MLRVASSSNVVALNDDECLVYINIIIPIELIKCDQ